jgi:hypothetical protein
MHHSLSRSAPACGSCLASRPIVAPPLTARGENLLRRPQITEQINRIYEGRTTALRAQVVRERPDQIAELNRLADEAVADVVARQIAAGLDVITEGEVRRCVTGSGLLLDADEYVGPDAAPRGRRRQR